MTPNVSNQPDGLLDPDTAFAIVHQQVAAPVFFNKLAADFGIRPASEDEAVLMLEMAEQLQASYRQQQEKQGSAQHQLLVAARDHLGSSLGGPSARVKAAAVASVAAAQAQNPAVAHAILSLQAAAALAAAEQ
jgi:hypothetical protein